jgi:hypothetical protein
MPDVQSFRKPYLPHPDSDLDVLYMNLDLLGESYTMVKSKLPFEDFVQGGLTTSTRRSNLVARTCQFWVSTPSWFFPF